MRAYDLTVTGSLIVSGSTTLTGDISYDDLTATGNIVTTGANKVISGSSTSTGSFGKIQVPQQHYLEFLEGGAGTAEKWLIFNNASNILEIKSTAYGGSPITIDATGGGVNVAANLDVGAGIDVTGGNVGIGTTSPSRALHVVGDALVTGILTAQEFHTEFVSASVMFDSGSTKFGDDPSDNHQFTGSLIVSGGLLSTYSGTGTGLTYGGNVMRFKSNGVAQSAVSVLRLEDTAGMPKLTLTDAANYDAVFQGQIESSLAASKLHIYLGNSTSDKNDHITLVGDGNVGIGTSSPQAQLHLAKNSPQILLEDTDVSGLKHTIQGGGNAGLEIGVDNNNTGAGYFRISLGGAQRVNISEGGLAEINLGVSGSAISTGSFGHGHIDNKLGIGISSPEYKIHVKSTDTSEDAFVVSETTGAGDSEAGFRVKNANGHWIMGYMFQNSGDATIFRASGTGNLKFNAGNILFEGANQEISGSSTSTGSFGVLRLSKYNQGVGGANNTVFGPGAGASLTTGNYGIYIGSSTGDGVTTGGSNILLGSLAGDGISDASHIVAIGDSAARLGTVTTDANGSVAVGSYSLGSLTSGQANVAVGFEALQEENDGDYNTAVGYQALTDQTGVSGEVANTAVGWKAGTNITTGIRNTIMGASAAASTLLVDNIIAIGYGAANGVMTADADGTVAIGMSAMNSITSGQRNMGIGYHALKSLTVGDDNIAIGYQALTNLGTSTFANRNIAIGTYALLSAANNNMSDNVAIGYGALSQSVHSDGDSNVAIGTNAMSDLTAGAWGNVAIGENSLRRTNHADSVGSVAVGYNALGSNVSGIGNVAIGFSALDAEDDGDYNTAIGYQALTDQTGVSGTVGNTAVGYRAGYAVTSGTEDTLIGYKAGQATTTGLYNTVVGSQAFFNNVDGDQNTVIGYAALYSFEASSDGNGKNVVIGSNAAFHLDSGTENTMVGTSAGQSVAGTITYAQNVAVGSSAMLDMTQGQGNVAIGYETLRENQTGDDNIMIGRTAGKGLNGNSPNKNIGIGHDSLYAITTGLGNVMIGDLSGAALTSGTENVGIGSGSLNKVTDSIENTAVGALSGYNITTGDLNTAIGYKALYTEDAGNQAVAIGDYALYFQNGGTAFVGNTAVGSSAGYYNVTGIDNTYVGNQAGQGASGQSNSGNTAVGRGSMKSVTTGHSNVAVGSGSLRDSTTGDYNTIIGASADTSAADSANQTVVGYGATSQGDNTVTLGNASVTAVYMSQDAGALVHTAGIQFPASQVANGGANVLDDYEEGTWTPTFRGAGGSAGSVNSTASGGTYTKIGRQVHIRGRVDVTNVGSYSGNIQMAGIPFTAAGSASDFHGTARLAFVTLAGHSVIARLPGSGNTIDFPEMNSGGGLTFPQVSEAQAGGNTSLIIEITYYI